LRTLRKVGDVSRCECDLHELDQREVLEKLSAWASAEVVKYAERTGDYSGAAELSCLSQRADDLLDEADRPECCERAVQLERPAICFEHGRVA
jgi:hypothetical protein